MEVQDSHAIFGLADDSCDASVVSEDLLDSLVGRSLEEARDVVDGLDVPLHVSHVASAHAHLDGCVVNAETDDGGGVAIVIARVPSDLAGDDDLAPDTSASPGDEFFGDDPEEPDVDAFFDDAASANDSLAAHIGRGRSAAADDATTSVDVGETVADDSEPVFEGDDVALVLDDDDAELFEIPTAAASTPDDAAVAASRPVWRSRTLLAAAALLFIVAALFGVAGNSHEPRTAVAEPATAAPHPRVVREAPATPKKPRARKARAKRRRAAARRTTRRPAALQPHARSYQSQPAPVSRGCGSASSEMTFEC